MGTGIHGSFGKTLKSIPSGDAVFTSVPSLFFNNIKKRKDIDQNGVFDVVAHGGAMIIQISHHGQMIEVDSRIAARLIKAKTDYKRGQAIRLLSCDTGSNPNGFAQNLSNKLNVVVEAPTKPIWAFPDGSYCIASRRKDNPHLPDFSNPGFFKKFYPGGKKK